MSVRCKPDVAHQRPCPRRGVLAAVWLTALCSLAGCAGSTPPASGAPQAGGEALEEAHYQCMPSGDTAEPRASEEEGQPPTDLAGGEPPAADGAAQPEGAARPTRTAGAVAPAGTEWGAGDWFEVQGQELGALTCALDATDCATAHELGDRICDLAQRVCALDAADPRCTEATQRCERARVRIRHACPARD